MAIATLRAACADLRVWQTPSMTAEQAREVLVCRLAVAAAARDQVEAMFGATRRTTRDLDPRRARSGRNSLPVPRPGDDAVVAWLTAAANLRDDTGTLVDPDSDHLAGYLAARSTVRAATDLLATHDANPPLAGASAAFRAASLPDAVHAPLTVIAVLARSPKAYLAARRCGLPQATAEHYVAPLTSPVLLDATAMIRQVAATLPPSELEQRTVRHPGIRTDRAGHEWADRVQDAADRFTQLATGRPLRVSIGTITNMAIIYAANDAVAALSTHGTRQQHLATVRSQLLAWRGIDADDPTIIDHRRALVRLTAPLRDSVDTAYARDLQRAALRCAPVLDTCAHLAEQIASRVDRWVPARPTPPSQQRFWTPPIVATKATEPLLPWRPGSSPGLAGSRDPSPSTPRL